MIQEWFNIIQEWFCIGARLGFIGFFAVALFAVLTVFSLGCVSILIGLFKRMGGDDDGQP